MSPKLDLPFNIPGMMRLCYQDCPLLQDPPGARLANLSRTHIRYPQIRRTSRGKLKEVSVVGAVGFAAPFLGCATIARYALGWSPQASLLCGVALSTTSMAVVYAVMLETGFNRTEYGKGILGACFVNDLGTVITL
ncbi:MAG: cation:proton antiporter, partial [candidate division NC10 bacterium]